MSKEKKQSYNQLSNISFSPFYTVSENNQSGTVKLFDCDLSSALNQTFGPTPIGGCPLFVVEAIYNQRSFFIYLRDILERGLRIFTNVWFCGVCDFYAISWASSNIVIHITIWIDFIYDRWAKSSKENDFFIPIKNNVWEKMLESIDNNFGPVCPELFFLQRGCVIFGSTFVLLQIEVLWSCKLPFFAQCSHYWRGFLKTTIFFLLHFAFRTL